MQCRAGSQAPRSESASLLERTGCAVQGCAVLRRRMATKCGPAWPLEQGRPCANAVGMFCCRRTQDAERRADMLIARKKAELQEMYTSLRRGERP